MNLTDKIALVTGGSAGIGRAIAESLIGAGAKVAITGRDQAKLDATVNELKEEKAALSDLIPK